MRRLFPHLNLLPAAPAVKRPKNESVETLRGLAILLIVVGHVIGIDSEGAMKVADGSFWRYIYISSQHLLMCIPLFAAISGWVYAHRPVRPGRTVGFLQKKARRLLVPMASVGTLYFLVQYVTPGTNTTGVLSEMWKIYVLPHTIYWFLPSLFLLFVFAALLDSRNLCDTPRAWVRCMVFSFVMFGAERWLSVQFQNVFSIWGAVALMPYFLLGLGLRRFSELTTPGLKKVLLYGFFLSVLGQQIVWFVSAESLTAYVWPLRLFLGLITVGFLLTHTWHNRFLIRIGSYTYSIYLFHAFGTAGGRIVLKMLGIHAPAAIFAFALVLGVGVPILIEVVLRRFPLLQTLFLGTKYKPAAKKVLAV